MSLEPRLHIEKYELCRLISKWVIEHCGIKHATIHNLRRLTQTDLELIYLAIGGKLDLRDITHMENQFRWEWERSGTHRTVDAVADQKAITDET